MGGASIKKHDGSLNGGPSGSMSLVGGGGGPGGNSSIGLVNTGGPGAMVGIVQGAGGAGKKNYMSPYS